MGGPGQGGQTDPCARHEEPRRGLATTSGATCPRSSAGDQSRQCRNTRAKIFPYSTDAISAAFTRATQFLGIEDSALHDLRHEACHGCLRSAKTFHTRLLFPATVMDVAQALHSPAPNRRQVRRLELELRQSPPDPRQRKRNPRADRGSYSQTSDKRVRTPLRKTHENRPQIPVIKYNYFVPILPRVALIRRDPLLQEFQRIERSHHGPRKIKPRDKAWRLSVSTPARRSSASRKKAFDRQSRRDHFWITSERWSLLDPIIANAKPPS